mmetsp:Transcript_31689/g.82387  ORF Transcript_31689/g.82387 Transcript_31689/m.82387 type:complete len:221 (-) Transcript_31689:497-1159(-)
MSQHPLIHLNCTPQRFDCAAALCRACCLVTCTHSTTALAHSAASIHQPQQEGAPAPAHGTIQQQPAADGSRAAGICAHCHARWGSKQCMELRQQRRTLLGQCRFPPQLLLPFCFSLCCCCCRCSRLTLPPFFGSCWGLRRFHGGHQILGLAAHHRRLLLLKDGALQEHLLDDEGARSVACATGGACSKSPQEQPLQCFHARLVLITQESTALSLGISIIA